MTCFHFEHLTEVGQIDVIWECGMYLGRRDEGFYKILLFQIQGFYSEVYYHSHFNVIIKIRSFSNTDLLEPYLNEISISELMNA